MVVVQQDLRHLVFSSIISEEIGQKEKEIRTLSVLHIGVEVPS